MHTIAAASSAAQYGVGAYLAVFALMALSFAGIPAIGAAVVGWAAVLASQGKLNIVLVLIVAALGAEAGGLLGYHIGDRWGRKLLDRPGRRGERLQKLVAAGERVYAKWGRLAVFFTSTMVSGILRMNADCWPVPVPVPAKPAGDPADTSRWGGAPPQPLSMNMPNG